MLVLNKGFNYSQDGPGNRLVYHLQGCNFACKWCSNADSIPVDNSKAKQISVSQMLDEILRSKMMFFDGGGVTFTGGEATLQAAELLELLKLLKANSISTCIETNASSPRLSDLSEFIDYLIVDIKHFDEDEHKKWTGASLANVKKNIEALLDSGRQLHIRIPVINGVNVNPEAFALYFSKLKTENAVFEFLAYHEYGKDKWLGKYQIENGFVGNDVINDFMQTFNRYGLKTVST
ncbi:MAG: radical SAM protein [Clostridia bacterium]|nr:radical SAM protein [Clostridia bacterium]